MTGGPFARAAYLRPATLAEWSARDIRRWVDRAADGGVTALITKLDALTRVVRDALAARGLDAVGSFSCYSDHRLPGAIPGGVAPVGLDGRPLTATEWYTGLVPGDPVFDDALVASLRRELRATDDVSWVVLDFLRWPGHWETESRNGGHPRPASFDPGTLRRFAARLGVASISPADAVRSPEWADFRTEIVTAAAARLAAVIREEGRRPAAFLVPLPHAVRRTEYGQDASALAAHADLFVLMSYQQMTGLDTEATLSLAEETARLGERPVVVMIQSTADAAYSGGWDWGPAVTPDDVAARSLTLGAAVADGRLAGTCFFPGEAPLPSLDSPHSPSSEGKKR